MKISRVKVIADVEIVRDGGFESLGFVTYSNPKQLIFIEEPKYLYAEILNHKVKAY